MRHTPLQSIYKNFPSPQQASCVILKSKTGEVKEEEKNLIEIHLSASSIMGNILRKLMVKLLVFNLKL